MSSASKIFISGVIAAGFSVVLLSIGLWTSDAPLRFACYLLVAVLASSLKVSLPGVTGTMSVSYVFILLSVIELSTPQTVLIGCAALLTQTFWHARSRPTWVHALFNVSSIALSCVGASFAYQHAPAFFSLGHFHWALVLSAVTYFLVNTLSIATVISLTEKKKLVQIWKECYFWSFPYYLLGASIAGGVSLINARYGWEVSVVALPAVYLIYRSYRLYLDRLEGEKLHAESMAALHLRTIEALALAIEAKDETTRHHLERVQTYAVAIGEEMGIADSELDALRAAAILHDIGKLAVPEHIISKPGKLTAEEFEKMKIHPQVGADILERVQFPYPVAPIVRAHHEKWDGSGYPSGLAGEEIPLGARILSVVDCLDALASDRQYRRALPLDEAMAVVLSESGKSFDPRIVEILHSRYHELEELARSQPAVENRSSAPQAMVNGVTPATGLEKSGTPSARKNRPEFIQSIAAARQEVQTLFELTQELGNSLSLHETLSVLDVRLKGILPYDAIAIYTQRGDRLIPEYVQGENSRLFASLEIPVGEGLSGWVAQNSKPIINGNPSVEPGYLNDPAKFSTLRSALAIPLEGLNGTIGVLTLYRGDRDAFTADHLRILRVVISKASLAIENALKFRQAEITATTDGLTGLPNARSLFLHLDAELSRCRRTNTPLAVLVCDLDGFKQVNDRFGHLEGNKVLEKVAKGLVANCRDYDYVARMGGDEFVLVLPGSTPEAIEKRIATLTAMVNEVGREVCGEELLSVSVGEAYCCPDNCCDAEQLLAAADRGMYRVKRDHKLATGDRPELYHLSEALA
ncbi:MAG TPA: HD domain-containing phosphohydrolase [Bryobacteraceae bacterium]